MNAQDQFNQAALQAECASTTPLIDSIPEIMGKLRASEQALRAFAEHFRKMADMADKEADEAGAVISKAMSKAQENASVPQVATKGRWS